MENILVILAAGKSSRMGGKPKHFCKIGELTNIEHTIDLAKGLYDKILLVFNDDSTAKKNYKKYKSSIKNIIKGTSTKIEVRYIDSGYGDADAVYKALTSDMFIERAKHNYRQIIYSTTTICWGDTYFVDDSIFKISSKPEEFFIKNGLLCTAFCALDKEPYAWFDVSNDKVAAQYNQYIIEKAHFKKNGDYLDNLFNEGVHDQSVFNIHPIGYEVAFENYCEKYNDGKEIKFLDVISTDNLHAGKSSVMLVEPNKTFSYNTEEELREINNKIL